MWSFWQISEQTRRGRQQRASFCPAQPGAWHFLSLGMLLVPGLVCCMGHHGQAASPLFWRPPVAPGSHSPEKGGHGMHRQRCAEVCRSVPVPLPCEADRGQCGGFLSGHLLPLLLGREDSRGMQPDFLPHAETSESRLFSPGEESILKSGQPAPETYNRQINPNLIGNKSQLTLYTISKSCWLW